MSSAAVKQWYQWVDEQPGMVLLDGGLGSILSERGNNLDIGTLWSGGLLVTSPTELQKVTDLWLGAGSDIVVTATYQVTASSLCSAFQLSDAQARNRMHFSVELVNERINAFWDKLSEQERKERRRPIVGISFGPYSALLPDTTEYEGTYHGVTSEDFQCFHRERCQVFQSTKSTVPQLYCFETIGNVSEAKAIVKVMSENDRADKPYWMSFQCRNEEQIACGEKLFDVIESILGVCESRNLIALGVNCVSPECVSQLIAYTKEAICRHMKKVGDAAWRIDTLVYPNSGEQWIDGKWVWNNHKGDNRYWIETVRSSGAKLAGGCCRVGPDIIRSLHLTRERSSSAFKDCG